MEWANGDIRCNYGRTIPLTNVQETVVDFHGYPPTTREYLPPSRDYPPQTHLEYGTGVPRGECGGTGVSQGECVQGVPRGECTPNHCGYRQPAADYQYGIVHPNYQISSKSGQAISSSYPGERREYLPSSQRDYLSGYPAEPCAFRTQPPYSERSPCVGGPCRECPGGSTCDYSPAPGLGGGSCYPGPNECQVRSGDLGPPKVDILPDVRASAGEGRGMPPPDIRPTTEVHHMEGPPEPRPEMRHECYDTRSLRSHHASHCDLREFQEWREMRGSRESVGTLPPELETHLKDCRCPCDHLGYGNYQVRHTCFFRCTLQSRCVELPITQGSRHSKTLCFINDS